MSDFNYVQQPQPWKPTAYMKRAVKFLLEHAAAGLLFDPGLRKTSITLAALKVLFDKKKVKKVLVVAPLRPCYLVWPAEIKKWADFCHLKYEVLHGPDKEAALHREADIYIINFDGLAWLTGARWETRGGRRELKWEKKRWEALGFDMLVVDELSKLKHSSSFRFKIMKLVLPTFSRRWGLTGSPAANSLLDLFGQAFVLDMGKALGQYVTHYRMKFFQLPHYGSFKWVIKPGAEDQIYQALDPLVIRESSEDHLDLPPLLENTVRVDLPPRAREIYDDMEEQLVAQLDENLITAANAATAANKCRQIASGAVYTEDPFTNKPGRAARAHRTREYEIVHDAKLDALCDLIDELQGQPIFVAYEYQHELERLRERLGKDTPALAGGTSMKESQRIESAWNRGEIPVLLAHPQAAGHGLNLQESGSHVAWLTLTWDYELYDQFIRRVYRSGVKAKRVTVHQFVARGTVDEAVLGSLRKKKGGQSALFEALKNMRRKAA